MLRILLLAAAAGVAFTALMSLAQKAEACCGGGRADAYAEALRRCLSDPPHNFVPRVDFTVEAKGASLVLLLPLKDFPKGHRFHLAITACEGKKE